MFSVRQESVAGSTRDITHVLVSLNHYYCFIVESLVCISSRICAYPLMHHFLDAFKKNEPNKLKLNFLLHFLKERSKSFFPTFPRLQRCCVANLLSVIENMNLSYCFKNGTTEMKFCVLRKNKLNPLSIYSRLLEETLLRSFREAPIALTKRRLEIILKYVDTREFSFTPEAWFSNRFMQRGI